MHELQLAQRISHVQHHTHWARLLTWNQCNLPPDRRGGTRIVCHLWCVHCVLCALRFALCPVCALRVAPRALQGSTCDAHRPTARETAARARPTLHCHIAALGLGTAG